MTELAEQVVKALREQGFEVEITETEVHILTPDRRRKHILPAAFFQRNARRHTETLIIAVIALEMLEGFEPPASFRE